MTHANFASTHASVSAHTSAPARVPESARFSEPTRTSKPARSHASAHTSRSAHPSESSRTSKPARSHTPSRAPEDTRTELVFILDKSGSMSGLEADTVGGYNTVLAQNRELPGEATVSTVLFDQTVRVVHDRVPIQRVQPLARRAYQPGGCTALLDAVGGAIAYHRIVQRALPRELRADRVLFVITTDGYENASARYSYPQVKQMISCQREQGWEFLFLGADIDAAAEAEKLGISQEFAMPCEASPEGMGRMYEDICEATSAVRCGTSLEGWVRGRR